MRIRDGHFLRSKEVFFLAAYSPKMGVTGLLPHLGLSNKDAQAVSVRSSPFFALVDKINGSVNGRLRGLVGEAGDSSESAEDGGSQGENDEFAPSWCDDEEEDWTPQLWRDVAQAADAAVRQQTVGGDSQLNAHPKSLVGQHSVAFLQARRESRGNHHTRIRQAATEPEHPARAASARATQRNREEKASAQHPRGLDCPSQGWQTRYRGRQNALRAAESRRYPSTETAPPTMQRAWTSMPRPTCASGC